MAEAEARRALAEPVVEEADEAVDLLRGRGLVCPLAQLDERRLCLAAARRRMARVEVVLELPARGDVPRRRAVVDRRAALLLGVPGSDGPDADLHVERRRDAVARLEPAAGLVLPVRVHVDEARRDDEPGDVDDVAAREPPRRDRRDAPVADADVAHGVEAGRGSTTRPPVRTTSYVVLRPAQRPASGPHANAATNAATVSHRRPTPRRTAAVLVQPAREVKLPA
jgi:hypothetical protein